MSNPNHPLSEILANNARICSLEVSSNRPLDYNVLNKMKYTFCSIVWIGNYNKAPDQVGPLALAKEMIGKGITVILHFTCRNNTLSSCTANLDYAKQIGIRNLMVVRGASPECNLPDKKYDFTHTPELLKFIKTRYGDYFELCVAGFPYRHPDSKDLEDDMKHLKEKNDAGAKFIITQACFSYDVYKEFLDNCRKHDFCFLQKLCKVPQSDPLVQKIKQMRDNDKEIAEFGAKSSLETVKKLLADKDFCPPHLYTMDQLAAIYEFLNILYEHE
ncbi:methylenetetrahydrofolate reductase-like [Harmonia axyridis]|uniref:methylenetetrahydrofolate reductase-like n=1 Tax=Harmonia axyridis TaxID=115357 RepID=UPI001E27785C|nr:methylenetetrahydrofolate reductase-like [Harmonia axyridis]